MSAPPPDLSPIARTVWTRVHARAVATGVWRPQDGVRLALLAQEIDLYVALQRSTELIGGERGRRIRREAEILRLSIRSLLVDWGVITAERARLAPLTPDGRDADIEALVA